MSDKIPINGPSVSHIEFEPEERRRSWPKLLAAILVGAASGIVVAHWLAQAMA